MPMIFPWNVDNGGKGNVANSEQEKIQFAIGVFVLINVVVAVSISSLLTDLGIPLILGYSIQVILISIVAVFVLRFVVFKEDERMQEYESGESFVKYYKLRKDAEESYDVKDRKILAYEYENGTCVFIMELKYGSNDTTKERNTKEVLEQIYRTVASHKLELRTIIMPEDFLAGIEARDMMNLTRRARGRKVGSYNLQIVNDVLENTKESNLECLYIMVKTTAIYQKYELDSVLNFIISLFTERRTCFREVNFLDKKKFVDFMRRFYGVEAIDLSMIKAVESDTDTLKKYQEMVSLYQINSEEGKSYTRALPETKKTNVKKL